MFFFMQLPSHFCDNFRQSERKRGIRNECFLGPSLIRRKSSPGPQKVRSGASSSQKAPKMEPKSDTFGVPLESRFLLLFIMFSPLLRVPGWPPNRSYFGRHSRALFFEAPGLKKAPKAVLKRFWDYFGLPFGTTFGFIWLLFFFLRGGGGV